MSLSEGTRLGPYQILSSIGAGGMGEVYRARDLRLARDVAIKALPDFSIVDSQRVARFQREAQILASLNHPHVAAIYGLEEVAGSRFLILELVEGDTLATRLSAGPLPFPEALTIARQIADALGAAHDKGIIHRDLKPANIALTRDGHVKVLDFGLAKVLEPDLPGHIADSPTITSAETRAGVILGTAAYMSPEQARGKPLDERTDIWAFGCVVFEMLTGSRAFPAATASDTIAALLTREPDWRLLPPGVPARIRWLLRRCLEKDPTRRLHAIADARIEIDDAVSGSEELSDATPDPAVPRSGPVTTRERVAWIAAGLALTACVAALVVARPDPPQTDMRTYSASIVLPDGVRLWSGNPPGRFALSPDGRRLALVASDASGKVMLWIRPLDTRVAQPLAGTEGASFPFWSPDSKFIAFLAERKLKKVDVSGGPVVTLCDASFGATGAWSQDDVILFTPRGGGSPLYRVSAAGGTPVQATTLGPASGETLHAYPSFLPDGRHFLYFVVGSTTGGVTDPRGVHVASLDSNDPGKLVLPGGSNAKYANGHLIFLRDGTLVAQRFNADSHTLDGEPAPLVEHVQISGAASGGAGGFSVSENGVLAYQSGLAVRSQLAWFDRAGSRVTQLGDQADYGDVALSPDDSRLAVAVLDPVLGTRDVWIFDLARGLRERFTFDPVDDFAPNWLRPDGRRLVFSSRRQGSIHLYEKPSDGSGTERLLFEDGLGKFNASSSWNGKFLVYVGGGGIIGRSDVWILPLTGDRKASAFLDSAFIETQGQFSPDGRWLAYTSNESGQFEVYVVKFPERTEKWRVSTAGGSLPRWNRNGREILYVSLANVLIATAVNGDTSRFDVGAARPLFRMPLRPATRLDAYPYDLTADGRRLLVNTFVEDSTSSAISLIVNWTQ